MGQNLWCQKCGKSLKAKQQKYCSKECRTQAIIAKQREGRQKEKDSRTVSQKEIDYRLGLLKRLRAGEELTNNEVQDSWGDFDEYLEVRKHLKKAVPNDDTNSQE